MTSTMTGNGIFVHAVTTAFIGGNGWAYFQISQLKQPGLVTWDLVSKSQTETTKSKAGGLRVEQKGHQAQLPHSSSPEERGGNMTPRSPTLR